MKGAMKKSTKKKDVYSECVGGGQAVYGTRKIDSLPTSGACMWPGPAGEICEAVHDAWLKLGCGPGASGCGGRSDGHEWTLQSRSIRATRI